MEETQNTQPKTDLSVEDICSKEIDALLEKYQCIIEPMLVFSTQKHEFVLRVVKKETV